MPFFASPRQFDGRLAPASVAIVALLSAPAPALAAQPEQPESTSPATDGSDTAADETTATSGAAETSPDDDAAGQPPSADQETIQRAMEVYHRGSENYALERYEQALADFQEASSLYASPDFQYNIGLCYEKLGKYEDAIRSFEIYLRAKPNSTDHAEVERRVDRLKIKLQEQREAEAANEAERQRLLNAKPKTVIIDNTDNSAAPFIVSGAVMTGLGAALALGGGITFGVLANRRSDELDEVLNGGNPEGKTFEEAQALEDEGSQFEIAQIATLAVGSAVAIAGVSLLAVGLHRRGKARRARASIRLAPYGSIHAGGLAISGRF